MDTLKTTGQRGSWFASIDGELFPCVHKHWFKNGRYIDPGVEPGQRIWDELIEGLENSRRAILTNDEVSEDGKTFARTGYIALFEIENVRVENDALCFSFVKRLANLK